MYEVLINVCVLIIGILLTGYYYEGKIDRLNKKHDDDVHQMIAKHEAEVHQTTVRAYNEGWRDGEAYGRQDS